MKIIVLHGSYRQTLSIPQKGSLDVSEHLTMFIKDQVLTYQSGKYEGSVGQGIRQGNLVVYPFSEEVTRYTIEGQSRLVISSQADSDLFTGDSSISLILTKTNDGQWQLQNLSSPVYLNNHLLIDENTDLPFGAEIAFNDSLLKVFPKEIWVWGAVTNGNLIKTALSHYHYYEDYPDYHRSPRLIYRPSEEKVTINAPQAEPNKPRNELLKMIIPPLAMIGVVILISIFQPRGLYILMSVVMSITTGIFSVQNYFRTKKEYKQSLVDRISAYHAYLSDKSIQLTKLANEQRFGQLYHYPALAQLDTLAQDYSHRIYEKTPQQFDFLYYRLGLGEVTPSYKLEYSQKERSGVKDPLEVEGFDLYESQKKLTNMPVLSNLKNGPVGYVGERELVIEQLQLLVNQLAFFHSYHDLQFITVMPEAEKDQWHWMRWLPHATLQDINVRGFVYDQRTRDQVLNSLNQILKQRQLTLETTGKNQEVIFSPHYVVLITDETLVMDHVIMEFFNEDPTALGCSLIFVQDIMRSLSENVKTVVRLKDQTTGELVMEEGILKEISFSLDHFPESYDKENISRRLAPLNHLESLKSAIPESVTFLEMYGVKKVDELAIPTRWKSHSPHKSLAVPLGLRGADDYVMLDLHERAHGPHGLIAGTTGSGKSELIQSYILSLAVNFHPYDVSFLLIDYKGGGMADLFKELPHLLGTITNLDGAQSIRALASIQAELRRRQRLFSKYEVNHINAYQKKYKLGEAKEPMPHLFLISDEFAELKTNEPDFMKELVSTARIGRSLGVHLILATQKPTGVVDDQIWSNSRFKIALKVADRSDSQEMLHTPDASEITQSGRAYLQVGNNEVYELFQSAWSGADYAPEKEDQGIEDSTISLINELGQYEILNQDLSGLERAEDIREVPTELDTIVGNIQQIFDNLGVEPLPRPWLPPLKERIGLPFQDFKKEWTKLQDGLTFTIGIADMPYEQKQEEIAIDLVSDGHVALFGGPGTGKSSFLQTAVLSLVRRYTPEELEVYLVDFGTSGLSPLKPLPHIADNFLLDQADKIRKLVKRLSELYQYRKRLLAKEGVATLEMYEQVTHKSQPHILVVIDNYESMKDEPFELEMYNLLLSLARDGVSLGIHLLITAGRQIDLRVALHSNIKIQLTLKQNDSSEVTNIVGSTPLRHMDDIKGRALMAREQVDLVQFYLPFDVTNAIDMSAAFKEESQKMANNWSGNLPKPIPMVPEILTNSDLRGRSESLAIVKNENIVIGLDKETVSVTGWNRRYSNLLYLTNHQSHMQDMLSYILEAPALAEEKIFTFAPNYHNLPDQKGYELLSGENSVKEMLDAMQLRISERYDEKNYDHEAFVIFYDFSSFVGELDVKQNEKLAYILEKGRNVGYTILILSDGRLATKIDSASKTVKATKQMVIDMRLMDQQIVTAINKPTKELLLGFQEQYFIKDRIAQKLQVTYTGD